MNATIKRIGGNEFVVIGNGVTVLISYETPVAVLTPHGRVHRSATRFSRSTERHINKFSRGHERGGTWLQENLDRLLFELIGDVRLRGKAASIKNPGFGQVVDTEGINYDNYTEPGDRNLVIPPRGSEVLR